MRAVCMYWGSEGSFISDRPLVDTDFREGGSRSEPPTVLEVRVHPPSENFKDEALVNLISGILSPSQHLIMFHILI